MHIEWGMSLLKYFPLFQNLDFYLLEIDFRSGAAEYSINFQMAIADHIWFHFLQFRLDVLTYAKGKHQKHGSNFMSILVPPIKKIHIKILFFGIKKLRKEVIINVKKT